VQLATRLTELRGKIGAMREKGGKLALVPTMGALHAGHIALVSQAIELADHVITSIFVNPTQFGKNEDLDAYPRPEAEDRAKLQAAGCDLLWAPTVDQVYPDGYATTVRVTGISEGLCGGNRPGHFDGVATVVTKLLNQVRPDIAIFGEKDYQQLALIRRLARDLDFETEIVGVPTVREPDGLAMSSRNKYLSASERNQAAALPTALAKAASAIIDGGDVEEILAAASAALIEGGFSKVDYFELRDADTLATVTKLDAPARLLAAAKIGKSRLIDNIAVLPR
jgi:pantoate--beta-alanine ligase